MIKKCIIDAAKPATVVWCYSHYTLTALSAHTGYVHGCGSVIFALQCFISFFFCSATTPAPPSSETTSTCTYKNGYCLRSD